MTNDMRREDEESKRGIEAVGHWKIFYSLLEKQERMDRVEEKEREREIRSQAITYVYPRGRDNSTSGLQLQTTEEKRIEEASNAWCSLSLSTVFLSSRSLQREMDGLFALLLIFLSLCVCLSIDVFNIDVYEEKKKAGTYTTKQCRK